MKLKTKSKLKFKAKKGEIVYIELTPYAVKNVKMTLK